MNNKIEIRRSVCNYHYLLESVFVDKYISNVKMNKSENNTVPSMAINVNHILTFLFILIAIIGILGNLLVIISVEFDARMRRSLTNQLIIRVASCDLIILLFNIPDIIQFVSSNNGNWVLSEPACKFIRTILVLAQYASVLTMCALTFERLRLFFEKRFVRYF
jgi:hypothetical protein